MEFQDMEEATEVDVNQKIPQESGQKKGKKNAKNAGKNKTTQGRSRKKAQTGAGEEMSLPAVVEDRHEGSPGITVSVFDYSVENHFNAVDTISKLCGEPDCSEFDEDEIGRLSSSITFLREWRHFSYQPKTIRFACQSEDPLGNDVIGEVSLPQFSAATVPQKDRQNGNTMIPDSNKDFVMYVGGPVWALDWCPRFHQGSESHIKSEFIAVAAHPPESMYHNVGAPLTGRGVIQIWCLLNLSVREEDVPSQVKKKTQQNSRNSETVNAKSTQPKKPRGRPRKKPINESVNNLNDNVQHAVAVAVQHPEDLCQLVDPESTHEEATTRETGRKRKTSSQGVSANGSTLSTSGYKRLKDKARKRGQIYGSDIALLMSNENEESSLVNPKTFPNCGKDPEGSSENIENHGIVGTNPFKSSIPKDIALPRLVFGLAHNGKVAWDVKWRPSNVCNTESKHRMGYLAVLLGNGALEVWEVPFPHTIKVIYSACQKEGTDPRFIKLEPVFRCSLVKCGERQSIPLTVEWSASYPHDLILAGCHDGVVALWKFSTTGSSKDTRPLLCFSADTIPIRAIAWAPVESDPESANVIITGGHKGLKFWDIRDPFRPLWDLNPVQRTIYSLDWMPNPRCVIVSFDDGTLRILSLAKAAYDVPVTGKPFVGTQQQGFHSYLCSSFAIWSVQASRATGMVAYCGADGNVLRFLLTIKAVEKDPLRNRAPHYLCGSLTLAESALTVITPLPGIPFPMKKSLNEWGNVPRTIRGFLSVSNQEKRAKEEMTKNRPLDDQPLAVCYYNDPGIESGSDEILAAEKGKQLPKSKARSKKKLNVAEALGCRDEEPQKSAEHDSEAGEKIEDFAPKIVAMHRVRWNMNKGSERWLCYGGAAGILRCQEIDLHGTP